jgi:hypothetical protein
MAKLGSEYLFIGPKSACYTSAGTAKEAIMNWANRDHKKYWTCKGFPTRNLCQKN